MATITRIETSKGEVRYKAIIKSKGVKLTSKTFTTKGNARTWARRIEADAESVKALGMAGARIAFPTAAKEYLVWWRKQGRKDKSVPSKVKWWTDRLDGKLTNIDAALIKTHLDAYEAGTVQRYNGKNKDGTPKIKTSTKPRSAGSVNRMKATLSAVFRFAVKEQHYLRTNPVHELSDRTEPPHRVRWLSDDERKALLESCKASECSLLHVLVTMAITTGARLGELLRLRWSDIDFTACTATLLTTKNGESRVLTLPTPAIAVLKPVQQVGNGMVFPSEKNPHRPFEFRPHWNAALKAAGIENFRFHDLRHTAASYLVMNGATLHEAGEVLGHKRPETTKRYAHLSTQHKAALTQRVMGGIFDES